jgi:hypothetical protein
VAMILIALSTELTMAAGYLARQLRIW